MTRYAIIGFISAVVGLFILPEIFGSAAILLGAYTWKKRQGNLGLAVLIFAVIFMIVGIEVTAFIQAMISSYPRPRHLAVKHRPNVSSSSPYTYSQL
jgi:hypothetical protein